MKILGKWPVRSHRERVRAAQLSVGAAAHRVLPREPSRQCEESGRFEPPRIMLIGSVCELTTGSSSSGNKDANSQYYW